MKRNQAAIFGVCVVVASGVGAGRHVGSEAVDSAIGALEQPRVFEPSVAPTTLLGSAEPGALHRPADDPGDLLPRLWELAVRTQVLGMDEAPPLFTEAIALPDAPPIPGWRGWESRRQFEFNSDAYLFVPIGSAGASASGADIRLSSMDAKRIPRAPASADGGAVDSVR